MISSRFPTTDQPDVVGVLRALARLPFNQRAALAMRELEGRSYAEIADTIGVSVSAVETLIFRARKTLRLKASSLRSLAAVPLPTSLTRLFESGGVVAGGGAAAGTGLVMKAAVVIVAAALGTGVGGDRSRPAAAATHPGTGLSRTIEQGCRGRAEDPAGPERRRSSSRERDEQGRARERRDRARRRCDCSRVRAGDGWANRLDHPGLEQPVRSSLPGHRAGLRPDEHGSAGRGGANGGSAGATSELAHASDRRSDSPSSPAAAAPAAPAVSRFALTGGARFRQNGYLLGHDAPAGAEAPLGPGL